MAPHLAEEAWAARGHDGLIADAAWPTFDPALLIDDQVTLAIQVNGKLRGTIAVAVNAARDEIEKLAMAESNVAKFLEGQTVKKVIVVPGKIVNIVVG